MKHFINLYLQPFHQKTLKICHKAASQETAQWESSVSQLIVQIIPIFLDLSGCNLVFSSFSSPWILMPKLTESPWAPYFSDCISHPPLPPAHPKKKIPSTSFFLLESTPVPPSSGESISPCEPKWFPLLPTLGTFTRIRARAVFRVQLREEVEFSLDISAEREVDTPWPQMEELCVGTQSLVASASPPGDREKECEIKSLVPRRTLFSSFPTLPWVEVLMVRSSS